MYTIFIPITLLLSLGIIWGSGYVIAKFAILNGVTPLGYSFWQAIGPAILLLSISSIRKQLIFSKQHVFYYFVCGLIGIAIPNTIMYLSAAHLPSGIISVIVNIQPIIIYPLAIFANFEVFKLKKLLCVIFGLFGLMILLLPNASLPSYPSLPWALLTLITPLSFSLCALFINRYRPKNSTPLSLSTGMLLFAAILLAPIIIFFDGFYPITLPLNHGDYAILLEIILSSIGYLLLFALLKRAGVIFYSFIGCVVCLTGLFWGFIIYHEPLQLINVFAIILILFSIFTLSIFNINSRENSA